MCRYGIVARDRCYYRDVLHGATVVNAGFGYTLATGRLFCDFGEFHAWTEILMGRPIYTHEFGSDSLWTSMRDEFERQTLEIMAHVVSRNTTSVDLPYSGEVISEVLRTRGSTRMNETATETRRRIKGFFITWIRIRKMVVRRNYTYEPWCSLRAIWIATKHWRHMGMGRNFIS